MSSKEPASQEVSRDQMLKDLQSWWEIPSIAQYISLFRDSFHLPEIEIEELENGLIDNTTNGPSEWLEDLLMRFLKALMPSRINKENWEGILQKLVTRKCEAGKKTPFPAETPFSKLSLRAKVEIIYSLCLYRLDRSDITEVMKSMDADALRVQKLGFDDSGNTYWYFYGTRLYKEEESIKPDKSWDEEWKTQKKNTVKRGRGRPRKIQASMKSDSERDNFDHEDTKNDRYMNVNAKSRWSVVCDTIEEWVNFAEKFKESKSKNEKALFQIVQENFLPTLNKIYEEKEKKFQQKLKELMPTREKIVTRRETRKQKGDIYESPVPNGYSSSDDSYKKHMIDSRARRLEERNKRTSQIIVTEINKYKRQRQSESFESSTPDHSQDDNDDSSLTQKFDVDELNLQSQIENLMSSIMLHKDAWPFLYPVDEEDAPYYYDIIKDPMDLITINKKLRSGVYETVAELDEDFSLIVTNCKLYNGENHDIFKMVQTLWRMFKKGISKILDSVAPEQNSNDGSENNSSSSDGVYQSPQVRSSKKHRREKRKTKKQAGMEALEMLAQATEIAIQTSDSNDLNELNNLNEYDGHQKTVFSNLKVSSINSHPPSLIERFSSESSNDGEVQQNASHSADHSFETSNNNARDYARENQIEASMPVSNESASYMNSNLAHLTNFIEKHNITSLNALSSNDITNVLSDGGTSHHENNNRPIIQHVTVSSNEQKDANNLDQRLEMLGDYNENVSNIFSQIIKQPIYNQNQSSETQTNIGNHSTFMDNNLPKSDAGMPGNVRKSPMSTSNFSGQTESQTSPLMQNINIQTDLGSPSDNLITVDASAIGLSCNSLPKNPITSTVPVVISQDHFMANQTAALSASNEIALRRPSPTYQSSSPTFQTNSPTLQSNSPTYETNSPTFQPNSSLYQPNLQLSSTELVNNQFYNSGHANVPPVTYQSMNFSLPATVTSTQANFSVSNNQAGFGSSVASSSSLIPMQVSATYPQTLHQQVQQQQPTMHQQVQQQQPTMHQQVQQQPMMHQQVQQQQQPTIQVVPQSNLMRFSIPPTGGQIKVVSEASASGPGVTYHVYAQSKMDNSLVEEHVNYVPVSQDSSTGLNVSPKTNKRKTSKQETSASRTTPPQKKPQPAQQYQAKSPMTPTDRHYLLTPLTTSTSTVRTSLPLTSSNFVPVNPQSPTTNRPFIIRPLKQNSSPNASKSTALQNKNSSYEPVSSKPVPVVFTGYNPPTTLGQNEMQLKTNQGAIMVQPNLVMSSNGSGMVQQVLFSPDRQPIQLSNGGRFIFASPQNNATGTAMFSNSQNQQLQDNNVRQVNQGFAEVVPQVISQAPMVQVSKDALQGIQYQTAAQNGQQSYQQVPQSSQYVNIPTFVITNQNQVQASVPQNVMSLEQYQMAQRRQMQINGQGNS